MTDILPATPAAPMPARLGQATAVEQSRAVAQVQAAAVMARQFPRDTQAARLAMQEVCRIDKLADRAFYSMPKGGSTVNGPSVHLARELARIWGNVDYGIAEMSRDDAYGQSEMTAWAWDLQTNARISSTFIVPHKRDKKVGGKPTQQPLLDLQEVYQNNANNGARRLREAIFAVLPVGFVEEAQQICHQTLEHGGGKPLDQRISEMIAGFARTFEVSEVDIARKLGRESAKWTEYDMAELRKLWTSLSRREIGRDEAFPAPSVTAAEIVASRPPKLAAQPAPDRAAAEPPPATDGAVEPSPEDIALWNQEPGA